MPGATVAPGMMRVFIFLLVVLRLVCDVFNLFDRRVSDIDYFYVSRLAGESVAGVEDVHVHPALPREIRVGLSINP